MFSATQPLALWHRLIGAWGVGLVLLLSVLAVRPDFHEAFCRHDAKAVACSHSHHSHGDASPEREGTADSCVVALFAQGHVLATLIIPLLLFMAAVRAASAFPTKLLTLVSVDYAWPHGCGPPVA